MMKRILVMLLMIMVAAVGIAYGADQVYFYHTDPAGTPLAMTNANGTVVWQADYKPFGEENTVTADPKNNKRFVGKEKDEETGLSYFGARYEDAKTGRFIAVDPVRAVDPHSSRTNEKMLLNPQRLNTYAYALNNPYRYVDPDGREVFLVARGLNVPIIGGAAVHTFIMLKPDNPKDFAGNGLWIIGGYEKNGKLSTEINNSTDWHWKKDLKGVYKISTPDGKTDTEFIKDIMTSFARYESENRVYQAVPRINQNQGNCNNVTSGALVGAGVNNKLLQSFNPTGFQTGLGSPLPEMVK